MDNALRLETMSMRHPDAAQKGRQHAEKVADQFETIFVRTMVQSLRLSATYGGESGMFGVGPGSDTYADWFDQNVAEHVCTSSQVGIKQQLMTDFERSGELAPAAPDTGRGKQFAATMVDALDRSRLTAARAAGKGGVDVLR